jgi:hypothetical protein
VSGGSTAVLGTHSSLRSSDVSGIALDPITRNLIVADELGGAGGRIVLIDLLSQAVTTMVDVPWVLNPMSNGTGQQQYAPDPGMPVLYFWDSTQSAVFGLHRATGALTTILAVDQSTPPGEHTVSYVNDLIFDETSGTLLLADNSSGSVLEIDPATSPAIVTTLFSGISMPHALALDTDGLRVYVASDFDSILVGPRSGGSLSVLAAGFPFMTDIVACGDSVFAVDKSLDSIFELVVSSGDDDCVPSRLANPDGDDNPRQWADQSCPAEHVLVGVRYGSMGSYGPDFVDAIAPICVPADDPFAPHVLVPNSEMGYPGEVTITCPSGEIATGIAYSELMGPAPNPDQIDGVTVICEDGAAPNSDIGTPSIVLACDGDAVGLAYKDKPDPYSDFAESVTPICGCDCAHGNGHHHGNGRGHSSHGNGHGYGHDCD